MESGRCYKSAFASLESHQDAPVMAYCVPATALVTGDSVGMSQTKSLPSGILNV